MCTKVTNANALDILPSVFTCFLTSSIGPYLDKSSEILCSGKSTGTFCMKSILCASSCCSSNRSGTICVCWLFWNTTELSWGCPLFCVLPVIFGLTFKPCIRSKRSFLLRTQTAVLSSSNSMKAKEGVFPFPRVSLSTMFLIFPCGENMSCKAFSEA